MNNPNEGLSAPDGKHPEIAVVRENDSSLSVRVPQNLNVTSATESFVDHGQDIHPRSYELCNETGVDVLVCK